MSWGEHITGAAILAILLAIQILALSLVEYRSYVGDIESIKEGLSVCNERLVLRGESCELVWGRKDE